MNPQGIPVLIARLLLAAMFLFAGIEKFTDLHGSVAYIVSAGLPMPTLLAIAAGVLELVASLMLIVGWQARWAGLALAGYTLLASVLFHNFWALPKEAQMVPMLLFWKNMAATGGLLMVFAYGAGTISLDQRRGRA
jgi:putative oxidoreductase